MHIFGSACMLLPFIILALTIQSDAQNLRNAFDTYLYHWNQIGHTSFTGKCHHSETSVNMYG